MSAGASTPPQLHHHEQQQQQQLTNDAVDDKIKDAPSITPPSPSSPSSAGSPHAQAKQARVSSPPSPQQAGFIRPPDAARLHGQPPLPRPTHSTSSRRPSSHISSESAQRPRLANSPTSPTCLSHSALNKPDSYSHSRRSSRDQRSPPPLHSFHDPHASRAASSRGLAPPSLHEAEKWAHSQHLYSASNRSPSPEFIVTPRVYPDEDDDDEEGPEPAAPTPQEILKALVQTFLSTCTAVLSIGITFYTLACLVWVLICAPVRLCSRVRPPVSQHIASLLVPPLLLQYRCITTPSSRRSSQSSVSLSSSQGSEGGPTPSQKSASGYSTLFTPASGKAVVLDMLAPFLALPLTLAAWIAAAAWALSAMVASESTGGDNENERALAKKVVGGWIRVLEWADSTPDRDEDGITEREWHRWWFSGEDAGRMWHAQRRRSTRRAKSRKTTVRSSATAGEKI